jgi:hypothetical protein
MQMARSAEKCKILINNGSNILLYVRHREQEQEVRHHWLKPYDCLRLVLEAKTRTCLRVILYVYFLSCCLFS